MLSPDPVIIRCLPWKVLVMIRRPLGAPRTLGFFLQCNGDSELPTWYCHARASLTAVAQRPGSESLTKTIDHTFCAKENDWGFTSFIPWTELMDPKRGFILPPLADAEEEEEEDVTASHDNEKNKKKITSAAGNVRRCFFVLSKFK